MRHMLAAAGLSDQVTVDSAGTTGWHTGEPPSGPAIIAAEARGYDFSGISARQLRASDFDDFNLILAMDNGHMERLQAARPAAASAQVSMFLTHAPETGRTEVPDPFYGGQAEYEEALDLVEAGCRGWVSHLKAVL